MGMARPAGSVYALLADGTTVEIRPAAPADFDAVRAMHAAMSPDNAYLRFFNLSRLAAETEARRICREPRPGRAALLALAGGEVIGCASYEARGQGAGPGEPAAEDGTADVSFAVADHMHRKGVATLLLEHLVSHARSHQITTFAAETLTENRAMLEVFADAGLPLRRQYGDGTIEMTFPLPSDTGQALDSYLDVVAARERRADAASLRHVFAPESVVVVGASRQRGTVGRVILDNIRTGGYRGRIYVVNPRARQIGGEPCLSSVRDLPEAADLAVIAVPAAAVLDTAEQCGRRGVHSLVVISSGLDTAGCADLLAACRRHGMRLIGPDCFGVAVPGIGLDATFAASHPRSGVAGLVMQSGGLGVAMMNELSRLGIGISSFASVGAKLDVSSNDMLMWWEQDGVTRLAVLYIDSFGNPRKFARTARRVGASMPVLTVHAGSGGAGGVSREALFEQAGVIVTPDFGELVATTTLLAAQPVPAGRTVAIVSNIGGAAALAADVCTDLGLTVHRPHGTASRRLRALLPEGATAGGPVDTTPAVSGEVFRQCLEMVAADEDVHAMIAIVLPTGATGDLAAAIQRANVRIPLAAVMLTQPESVQLLGRVPVYGYPEAAAAAIARSARYGAWRMEPRGQVPDFTNIRTGEARTLVRQFFHQTVGGGWLPPDKTADLLDCYGIPLAELIPAADEDDAVGVAAGIQADRRRSAVLKADLPGLMHKRAAGAVELDLRGEADVRAAYRRLTERFGGRMRRILVQPMITGTELRVGVADDRVFGSLVTFGPADGRARRAARLTPLTDTDADKLIGSAPVPADFRGGRPADLGALRDLLLRVSRLADDLPEVTDLELDPVIARPDGAFVVDARVKATPYLAQDPFLRRLR